MQRNNKISNANISSGIKLQSFSGNTVIYASNGKSFELIHRASAKEVEEILKQIPALDSKECIKFDNKSAEKPFKIVLGQGSNSKVRIAQTLGPDGTYQYIAVRKILATGSINKKNEKIELMKKELQLQAELKTLIANEAVSVSTDNVYLNANKTGEPQLYQFLPIAHLGDAANLTKKFTNAKLNHEEKELVFNYIAFNLLKNVSKLNAKGFFVCDIKPENILLNQEGKVVLADFGSAAYKDFRADTKTDVRYQAPKFLLNNPSLSYDARHDMWALSLTLLQMHDDTRDIAKKYIDLSLRYRQALQITDENIKQAEFQSLLKEYEAKHKELADAVKNLTEPVKNFILEVLDVKKDVQPFSELIKDNLPVMTERDNANVKKILQEMGDSMVEANLQIINHQLNSREEINRISAQERSTTENIHPENNQESIQYSPVYEVVNDSEAMESTNEPVLYNSSESTNQKIYYNSVEENVNQNFLNTRKIELSAKQTDNPPEMQNQQANAMKRSNDKNLNKRENETEKREKESHRWNKFKNLTSSMVAKIKTKMKRPQNDNHNQIKNTEMNQHKRRFKF